MRDPKTLDVLPVTTPAKLRRVEELLNEAAEILIDFQDEIEAAGDEDDDLSGLMSALDEPWGLVGSVVEVARKLADDYAEGRAPDDLIHTPADFETEDDSDAEGGA